MALGAALVPVLLLGSIHLASRLPFPRYPAASLALGPLDLSRGPAGVSPLSEGFIADVLGRATTPRAPITPGAPATPTTPGAPLSRGRAPVSVTHPLTNDAWSRAYRVPSVPFTATTSDAVATREEGEPPSCAPVGGTIWYRFDARADVGLVADSVGTERETTLGVFAGRDLNSLQSVGCATSARGNARVPFPARSGTTYYFQLSSLAGGARVFRLSAQGVTRRVSETGLVESYNSALFGNISGDGAWYFYTALTPRNEGIAGKCSGFTAVTSDPVTCQMQVFAGRTAGGKPKIIGFNSDGEPANNWVVANVASADGRYVALTSMATNLGPDDTNTCLRWVTPGSCPDIYILDRDADDDGIFDERHPGGVKTARASVSTGGAQANGVSAVAVPSGNGRYVVFNSWASNLVPGDTNAVVDVFRHDRDADGNGVFDETFPGARKTVRVSVGNEGQEARNEIDREFPIEEGNVLLGASQNARYVMFRSAASNLVPGDTNGMYDVFVRDIEAGTTTRVNVGPAGVQANRGTRLHNGFGPKISNDGRYAAFNSSASNLVPGDTNGVEDLFVRDLVAGTTRLVSARPDGGPASGEAQGVGQDAVFGGVGTLGSLLVFGVFTFSELNHWLTPDGRYVFFSSGAYDLVAGDENGHRDVFVRDLRESRTFLVSVSTKGNQADAFCQLPSASDDGRTVVFASAATALEDDPSDPADRIGYAMFLRRVHEAY